MGVVGRLGKVLGHEVNAKSEAGYRNIDVGGAVNAAKAGEVVSARKGWGCPCRMGKPVLMKPR